MNTTSKSLIKRWEPLIETFNVQDNSKKAWLAEYAQNHQNKLNEVFNSSAAYAGANGMSTPQNVPGMGPIVMPQPGAIPGQYGGNGSADISPALFPLAMKIAAQTIGLDLVAVQPTAGPVFKHVMMDFIYSDGQISDENEKSAVFQLGVVGVTGTSSVTTIKKDLKAFFTNLVKYYGMRTTISGLEAQSGTQDRLFVTFTSAFNAAYVAINPAFVPATGAGYLTEPSATNRLGALEFLGFSRINGFPMFRAFRKTNTMGQFNYNAAPYSADTFALGHAIEDVMEQAVFTLPTAITSAATTTYFGEAATYTAQSATSIVDGITQATPAFNTFNLGAVDISILPVSTMEDHLDGFSANWNRYAGMRREDSEKSNIMSIHPQPITRDIQVGDIKIKAAVTLNQMEDIKSATGKDLLPLVEAQLANELTQRISKEIVHTIFALGEKNRETAPLFATGKSIFDLDVQDHIAAMQGAAPNGHGENSYAILSKLWQRIFKASAYIFNEGRLGHAQYLVTNYTLAAALFQAAHNQMVTMPKNNLTGTKQLYPMGTVGDITIYVDPNRDGSDNRIALGRKNTVEEPGILFVPYLMAQSVQIINPTTYAPDMILRSRYAVAQVGWFPEKQFMTLHVSDPYGVIS